MADFESKIRIGIDNSQALEAIKALQREISVFQTSMARGTAAQQAAASKYQQELVSSINATGKFSANIRSIQTTTESFTTALEKNKLSFGQYFRYAAASTKTFGKSFQNELEVINKTARERVKDLQTQYVKLGRDASGAMQAIAIRPLALDLQDYGTKTAIAAQKQQILNQLLKQGSTNLLNFGKNTQWAGRQLMVGFTIPLSIFGSTAARSFMELEEQVIKFRKVYGDLFTTGPEREEALAGIRDLANGFTQYGIAVSDTISIAAEAAAAGFQSIDLQRQTEQAIRLSVLGQLEQQKALETTISLQNAFQLSSENLAESIDFLNAVENQTVVSLDDITTAVPKVAPVIQSLGGDVKDLAFFLAAMKEGGVNASEGANALKSGLASLINPTDKASQMLAGFGINIRDIVTRNAGNLKQTVLDFALALDQLDPLTRAQAIEQLFGKFQFARISTLFENVVRDGSQASRVLDLATASAGELAAMSERELGMTAASAMNQFKKAIEDLQVALAPIGELFLEIVTPLINFAADVLKNFNNLDEGVKKFIGGLIGLLGAVGPIAIMTFGLLANGIANIIKGFLAVRNVFANVGKSTQTLGEQTEYMTQKQLQELAVAASLEQAHMNLAQAFTSEAAAADKLIAAYDRMITKQRQFAGAPMPTTIGRAATKFANGGFVGGTGNGDTVPAMLTPGEFVVKKDKAKLFMPLLEAINNDKIPGFQEGGLVGDSDRLVRMFGEYAMRLQPESQNMAKLAGIVDRFEQVLAPLAIRIGEARGITPSQSRVKYGDFDDIANVYSGLTKEFTDKLNLEYETTFKDIKNTNERFRSSWIAAGKSVENKVNEIKSDIDRGVIRKTFGLDPDFMGTIPTMPRREGGTGLERARKSAFNLKDTGIRSYNTQAIRGSSRKLFEQLTGSSAAGMQMGHVFEPAMVSMQSVINDPKVSNAAKKAGQLIGVKVANDTAEGIKVSTKQASPSKEAFDAGRNIGIGAIQGLQSVAKETQSMKTYRIGPRRVTTDPNLAAQSMKANVFSPQRDATAIFARTLAQTTTNTKTNFDKFNSSLMNLSFAFSSVSALTSMFGGELGGATELMYGLSSALMALTAVIEIARITNLKKIAAERGMGVLEFIKGTPGRMASRVADAKAVSGVSKIFQGGIKNSFQNLTKVTNNLGGTFGKVASGFLRFLPVLGIAITAFSVFQLLSEAQENQRKKIEGLGNAANLTADQLKYLAEATGTQIQNLGFGEGYSATGAAGVDVSNEAKDSIATLREDSEEFRKQFEDVLYAIANSAPEAAQAALANLALQLDAKGFAPDIIAGIIEELKKEAGKKELDLSFIQLNAEGKLDTEGLKKKAAEAFTIVEQEVQKFNQKQNAQTFSFGNLPTATPTGPQYTSTGGYSIAGTPQTAGQSPEVLAAVNLAAGAATSQIQNLNKEFSLGLITVQQYNSQFDNILSGIRMLDPVVKGLAIDEMAAQWPEFAEKLKDVADEADKLLLLEAQVKGVKFDDTDIKEIAANGPKAEAIRKRLLNDTKLAAKLSYDAKKAEEDRAKAEQARLDLQGFDEEIANNQQILEMAPQLVAAGLDQKEAMDALTDAKWRGIFATAAQNGTTDQAVAAYKEYKASIEAVNGAMATADLANQITQLQQQNNVLAWLTQNGMSTAQALEVIGNSTYYAAAAAAMASGKFAEFNSQLGQIKALSAPLTGGGGGGQKSDYQQAIENLMDQKKEADNLIISYTKLRNAKLSANQAFAAAKDPIIAAAIATTKVGTDKWARLVRLIKQADAALKRSKLLELFAERAASNALLAAFTKITPLLSRMGLSLEDINDILNDPMLAQAFIDDLKDGVINSKLILDIINQIPTTKRIQLAFDMATPEGMMDVFDEAFSRQMDYFDLQERRVERSYEKQEKAAQKAVDDAQDRIDTIQKGIETIETAIEKKQRDIELTITRPIEALNNAIEAIERDIELNFNRPIADLQEESSDLSNELELMDRQADEINKRFDEQAQSLEKVNELSAEITERDKERLDVAQALASGNAADAVRALRKAREEEQRRAREKAAKALEIARENELARIRSTSGLTREQIEQRQFEISQQIFALEEQREAKQAQIRDIQDQIYALEQSRRKILDEIRILEDQIYTITNNELKVAEQALETAQDNLEAIQNAKQAKLDSIAAQRQEWEMLRDEAQEAMFLSNGYLTSLEAARALVEKIKAAWAAVGTTSANAIANITNSGVPSSTPTGPTGPGTPTTTPTTPPSVAIDYQKKINEFTARNKEIDKLVASLTGQIASFTPIPSMASVVASLKAQKTRLMEEKRLNTLAIQEFQRKLAAMGSAGGTGGGGLVMMASGGMVKQKYAMGGMIPYMGNGGMFKSVNTDTVPAMLTPGEFVVKRFAVEKFGEDNLKAINRGTFNGNSVYNYEVNVNVKSDANPDQIARAVMTQIKQIDSQRIRGNRF